MREFKNIWVYGYRTVFTNWINAKKVDDGGGVATLPHGILVRGPVYPQEQVGTTEDGMPIYANKGGAVKCIWLVSMHKDLDLLDEIKVLNGPYDIHDTNPVQVEDPEGGQTTIEVPVTVQEMRELYPEHWPMPYIC